MSYPKTLFARTGLTIAIAMLIFLLFSVSVVFYYVLQPVARQASGDLAALMVLSSQTWVELPAETRADFEHELSSQHGLTLTQAKTPLIPLSIKNPFLLFLEDALSFRLGINISILHDPAVDGSYWVDLPMSNRTLRIGFSHNRIRARPPIAVLMLILGASVFTLFTSLLLVRRLTDPLAHLADQTSRFGRGEQTEPLPEEGPTELALLAHNFNQMTTQVQQLMTNRTTLLGGISHDLRTPIARLQLAIALLDESQEPKLLEGMQHDLAEMSHLITRTLELAKGMQGASQDIETVELGKLLSDQITAHEHQGGTIEWQRPAPCTLQTNPTALNRVLANLLENAKHYGGSEPVKIELECGDDSITISLLDQGPGIPEEQLESVFQPFYRLENSRNQSTGGSGLGLAIVKQLCDIYGWRVQLQPRPEGGLIARLTIARSLTRK
ncbi:MAG: ATP-binding protein [Candidatus Polarisedimenticolaceae bacterium]|nr:ATP-binding protein [Candidatus Polarisedimenticolaceae bacterium]